MDGIKITVVIVFSILLLVNSAPDFWVWKCDSGKGYCTRLSDLSNTQNTTVYPSPEVCRLICGKYGALWPHPQTISEIDSALFKYSYSSLKFNTLGVPSGVQGFIEENIKFFSKLIKSVDTSDCPESINTVLIEISVSSDSINQDWSTDESYSLQVENNVNQVSVKISAVTVFGARHGLETVSQLMEFYTNDDETKCLVITKNVRITDAPAYPHRGLLLDTARNFLTVENIKRHIDAMAASKLNILHWHVTDSQSFPLEVPTLPNMTKYGAYSPNQIYYVDQVHDLFIYAKLRGIRIVIEIDAPSHAGNGWQWGPESGLGNLAVCINQSPYRLYCIEPPCGQLNPTNDKLYTVLQTLYGGINNYLPEGEIFHMGGDEVFIDCWNSTQEILDYLGDKPRTLETFLDLWSLYQTKALNAYDATVGHSDTPIILWTSHLTQVDVIEKYLSKERYVIQTWVPAADSLPTDLLNLGYRIIVSTKDAWYLDHGVWGTTVYHNWRVVYDNIIPSGRATLGGEVCMWGEYIDSSGVEARTWPRAAAAAERLWSNPSTSSSEAEQRFYRQRERLVTRGINAEALTPKWCYQNEGQCA